MILGVFQIIGCSLHKSDFEVPLDTTRPNDQLPMLAHLVVKIQLMRPTRRGGPGIPPGLNVWILARSERGERPMSDIRDRRVSCAKRAHTVGVEFGDHRLWGLRPALWQRPLSAELAIEANYS